MHSNLQTQPFARNHNPYLAKEFGIIPVSKNVKDEALTSSASTDFQALITCFIWKKGEFVNKMSAKAAGLSQDLYFDGQKSR